VQFKDIATYYSKEGTVHGKAIVGSDMQSHNYYIFSQSVKILGLDFIVSFQFFAVKGH